MFKNSINNKVTTNHADLEWDSTQSTLNLQGSWSWDNIDESYISTQIKSIPTIINKLTIDGASITNLDTIGAYFINTIINSLSYNNNKPNIILDEENKKLLDRVTNSLNGSANNNQDKHNQTAIAMTPKKMLKALIHPIIPIITFLGQTCVSGLQIIKKPSLLNFQETIRTIRDTGLYGMFVVLLLNFLIGTTLAYEMAPQFTKYGANVFIVNFLGISMLKEVSPLLTAIIIAGRTGSAITAEIGTMKVNEEIDAIKTMGISPFQKLIIPKILAVLIATPLLTALADTMGMIGGAMVANNSLHITYQLFIERTQDYVSIYNYTTGIIKSIAFGLSIGFIGCYCGMSVRGDANSIGEQTTRSVVSSIIMIILLDAIFAILFLRYGV